MTDSSEPTRGERLVDVMRVAEEIRGLQLREYGNPEPWWEASFHGECATSARTPEEAIRQAAAKYRRTLEMWVSEDVYQAIYRANLVQFPAAPDDVATRFHGFILVRSETLPEGTVIGGFEDARAVALRCWEGCESLGESS